MKVLIVGGLGYIGSALQDLYSVTEHDVTILDNSFNTLKHQNPKFNYIYGDITKIDFDCGDFDIVINLAGITMTYSTDEEAVNKVNNTSATKLAKTAKRYIFPSTNNIFGGYEEEQLDVDENRPSNPTGPYAKSKVAVEKWLNKNHNNYIICRFGTNYGYSNGLKYSPILNLFMLNSILGKESNVFGDGHNYRPSVHVKDAARALYFLAHSDIKNETFHVASRSDKLYNYVDEIKTFDSSAKIFYKLDKPNWFVGYQINNDKLRATGFEYKYTLKDGYEDLKEGLKNVQGL